MSANRRQILESYWLEAVGTVAGDFAVEHALRRHDPFRPDLVIAVGKAASSMTAGAFRVITGNPEVLIVRKAGLDSAVPGGEHITVIEAGHPVPDENSLRAGQAMADVISSQGPGSRLLLLVSGGASSLAELPVEGVSCADLVNMNRELLASGLSIGEMNAKRSEISRVKDGRLLEMFRGDEVQVYMISDVRGDDPAVIGSGIGNTNRARCSCSLEIVANNKIARDCVAELARGDDYRVLCNEETLYDDVAAIAAEIAGKLQSAGPGVCIWGGESTVKLPDSPGIGGRNLSLALSLAIRLKGKQDVGVLVAGTDGDDGNSSVAGAYIDGNTVDDVANARDALQRADAYTWFKEKGSLFDSGQTQTNVMDLAIALVGDAA